MGRSLEHLAQLCATHEAKIAELTEQVRRHNLMPSSYCVETSSIILITTTTLMTIPHFAMNAHHKDYIHDEIQNSECAKNLHS